MNERQAYALSHPLNTTTDPADAATRATLTTLTNGPHGLLYNVILAVDR